MYKSIINNYQSLSYNPTYLTLTTPPIQTIITSQCFLFIWTIPVGSNNNTNIKDDSLPGS